MSHGGTQTDAVSVVLFVLVCLGPLPPFLDTIHTFNKYLIDKVKETLSQIRFKFSLVLQFLKFSIHVYVFTNDYF